MICELSLVYNKEKLKKYFNYIYYYKIRTVAILAQDFKIMTTIISYKSTIKFEFKSIIITYDRTTKSFNISIKEKKIKKVSFGRTTIINYKSFNILEFLLAEYYSLIIMYSKEIENDEPKIQFGKNYSSTKPSITKIRELSEIDKIIEHKYIHNEFELYKSFLNFIKNKVDNHYYEYIEYILYNLIFESFLYKDPDDLYVDCTYYIKYQDFNKNSSMTRKGDMTRKGAIIKIINEIIFDIIKKEY